MAVWAGLVVRRAQVRLGKAGWPSLSAVARIADRATSFLFLVTLVACLAFTFWPAAGSDTTLGVLGALTIGVGVCASRGAARLSSLILLGLGASLLWGADAPATAWLDACRRHVSLLPIICCAPIVAIPIQAGGYAAAVDRTVRRLLARRGEVALYALTSWFAFLLSIILQFGAIITLYEFLGRARGEERERLIIPALTRGYSATLFCSPNSGAVGLVCAYYALPWNVLVRCGAPLSVGVVVAGLAIEKLAGLRSPAGAHGCRAAGKESLKESLVGASPAEAGTGGHGRVAHVGVALLVLVGGVFALERLTGAPVLAVLPLVSMPLTLAWSGVLGRRALWEVGRHFLGLARFKNEGVLYLCAGFMGAAVGSAGLHTLLAPFLARMRDQPLLLPPLMVLLMVFSSLVGIPPVAAGAALMSVLKPEQLGVRPMPLVLSLLAGWSSGVVCSPFSANNLVMGNLSGRSPFVIGLRWNLLYSLVVAALLILAVTLMERALA